LKNQEFIFLVEAASKAPSGHNTQPWKFENVADGVILHPDFFRALPVVDEDNHALYISLGCALENIVVAASNLGYECEIEYPEDTSGAISVKLISNAATGNDDLFDYISTRQSNRSKYSDKMVDEADTEFLKSSFDFPSVHLYLFNGREKFEPIIPYIIEGNNLQFSNRKFVDELTSWFRYSKRKAELTKDGLWTASMGLPSMGKIIGNFVMKNFVTAESEAKRISDILQHTAGIAIFVAEENNIRSWINVGRAFQRFGLYACKLGISIAHLNMPCEEISVRSKLAASLHVPDYHPLLLIRYGYAAPKPYSYRREIKDLVIN